MKDGDTVFEYEELAMQSLTSDLRDMYSGIVWREQSRKHKEYL